MYRYRETTGATRCAINSLKHLSKLGTIHTIRGYQYRATFKHGSRVNHRVKVIGTTGEAMFWDCGWGYFGQGPTGLLELFKAVGVPTGPSTIGNNCAFYTHMSDVEIKGKPVVDWELKRTKPSKWQEQVWYISYMGKK